MKSYSIAAIPGDGIGQEVIAAGIEALDALAEREGFAFTFDHFDWGSDYYKRHGVMMPADGRKAIRDHDAIFFGAVGAPDVPDHVTLWGLRLAICQPFDQYANVRPTRILPGITSPLRGVSGPELDWVIVRENSEGEYAGVGGRVHRGLPEEVATDVSIMTRAGVERIMRYAFQLARSRPRKLLTVVTKSNAQRHAMVMWDEIAAEVAAGFPDVAWDKMLVDAMTMRMTLKPSTLDTIVATNLHADILSDLAAALAGSLGIAPTGNINPERTFPSMFEPIHGSAFDITGTGDRQPDRHLLDRLPDARPSRRAGGRPALDAGRRAGDGRSGPAHAGSRRASHDPPGDERGDRGPARRQCLTRLCRAPFRSEAGTACAVVAPDVACVSTSMGQRAVGRPRPRDVVFRNDKHAKNGRLGTMRTWIAAVIGGLAVATSASAQPYPQRPITLVVPFSPGGPTDIISRIMGDDMSRTLGQQIVIENVVGAGGTVGVTRVQKSTPDGYTILMGNLGTQAASVGLYPKLAYDPRSDFEPIINAAATPMLVVAKNDLPVKDFREFVAYVKANADKLNYGTGGVGSTSHLTCLFLDSLLGVKPQHVPFRGNGPALNALLAGQIDYVCDQTVGVVPQVQAGGAKGLVVAVKNRLPVVPDVPTSVEQGLPEFQATGWNALFAPKGTPATIVARLNEAARAALANETTRKRLLDLGAEIPDTAGQTPQALADLVGSEIDKWVPVIRKSGVTIQ